MLPEDTERGIDAGIAAEFAPEGFEDLVRIGRGGFGVVYRCRQPQLERMVAIKVLSADPDRENLERFLREQRAMGRLSGHPNIVQILQVGVTGGGRPYIVMPYCRRDSLEAKIKRVGALSIVEAIDFGVKLAGAVETAHRQGILHRDIKPANGLLTDYNEPQLTDFGIARITGDFQTSESLIAGSPAYAAPEILTGTAPTASSDVYGLGATVFAVLAGRAAFARAEGEPIMSQFSRITTGQIPDLRAEGVPDDVATVVEKAMARNPEDRLAAAADLGAELVRAGRSHGLHIADVPLTDAPELTEQHPPTTAALASDVRVGTVAISVPRGRMLRPLRVATGLRPPRPTRPLVRRGRLLQLLDTGGPRRLVLIHAPAGYGKTTLALQWSDRLAGRGVATAWVSIDHEDNNVVSLLSHLADSLEPIEPELSAELNRALGEHGGTAQRYVLTTLINTVHATGAQIAVVVDDWHRITDRSATAAMAFLLENGCHHLQLILVSRTRPTLQLSRLYADNEVIEIDSTDLRFESAESRELLIDVDGLSLSAADIASLDRATEGWAAGLQLAALSLRARPNARDLIDQFTGSHRSIAEYLAENVLADIDRDLVDFMLMTSITEQVCGSLAAALTGTQRSQAVLEDIERRDLFLRRSDDAGRWFSYHHLFADYLRRRLECDLPDRIEALHRAAARWYADHNLPSEAVDHALAAGESDWAVDLVEHTAFDLLENSQMMTLLLLAGKLPPQALESHTRLLIALAWAHTLLRHPPEADCALRRVAQALEALPDDARLDDLRAESLLIGSSITVFGDRLDDLDEAIEACVARAQTLRPWLLCGAADVASFKAIHTFEFDEALRWQQWARPYHDRTSGPFSAIYGYCLAGIAQREQLDIVAAEDSFRHAIALANPSHDALSYGARLSGSLLGDLLYDQGRLAEAERLLDESHKLGAEGGIVDLMLATYGTGARIKFANGDTGGAVRLLAEGDHLARRLDLPRLAVRMENERIRAGLLDPHRVSIPPAQTRIDAGDNGIEQTIAELEEDSRIRLLLGRGTASALEQACTRAQALANTIDAQRRPRAALAAELLTATCLAAADRTDECAALLAPAMELCAVHGLTQWLREAGPKVAAVAAGLGGG